jgi:hypothetical protein
VTAKGDTAMEEHGALATRVTALEELAQGQEAITRLLTTLLENHHERLEELRRQTAGMQRLWVRLAQRYGWLEDDDLS